MTKDVESFHENNVCERTYATLCLYGEKFSKEIIEECLEVECTDFFKKGEISASTGIEASIDLWLLSSQNEIKSKDFKEHVLFLLSNLSEEKMRELVLKQNVDHVSIQCYWESASGNGGPIITPELMLALGQLGISLEFDIWF